MNIVGVGGAGCKIVKQFTKYPQYTVHYIDHVNHGKGSLTLKKYDHPEKYEENAPDFTTFVEHLEGDDVIIVTCGASIVSSVMLRLLEKMQEKNVTVHYIKPDLTMLSKIKTLNERLVRNVLQHFARSGMFDRVFLWDNQEVENIIGDVPVIGFWDTMNDVISSTIHSLNVFDHTEPVMGQMGPPGMTCRISSVGIKDMESNEEKMFFPLDNVRESCYIYNINEERLKESTGLLKQIKEDLKAKLSESLNISFGIFPSSYDRDFGYVLKHTSFVQNQRQE